jgi:hypothetical protein
MNQHSGCLGELHPLVSPPRFNDATSPAALFHPTSQGPASPPRNPPSPAKPPFLPLPLSDQAIRHHLRDGDITRYSPRASQPGSLWRCPSIHPKQP